jgi:hypothetical protein
VTHFTMYRSRKGLLLLLRVRAAESGPPRHSVDAAVWSLTGEKRRAETLNRSFMSSGPEDFHLRALPEPYVNLSIHTAPIVQPLP